MRVDLPRMHFSLAGWQAMPILEPGEIAAAGQYFRVRGNPVVGNRAPACSGQKTFFVRPIVRVPMRKANS